MDFNEYQQDAYLTAEYPAESEFAVLYTALGLAGEAGEVANKVKKLLRGDYDKDTLRLMLANELGDVLWYVAMLAYELNLPLEDIARDNIMKLKRRAINNTIKGTGDNR